MSVLATTLGAALLGTWLVETLIFAYFWVCDWRDMARGLDARPLEPTSMR